MSRIIKSKYRINEPETEDMISFGYYAEAVSESYWIWEYKAKYLNANLIKRLEKTAQKLLRVRHPNVQSLLDYHSDGQSFYTIHPITPHAVSLEDYLKRPTPKTTRELWQLITQIIQGMMTLEVDGLAAGTLNLSQLWMSAQNSPIITRPQIPSLIFQANISRFKVLDDAIFFAPECLTPPAADSSIRSYTIRSDIYSLGVLMTIFFSNQWPYPFTHSISELQRHLLKGPKPFRKANASIPDKIVQLVHVCMSFNPNHRFDSFRSLAEAYRHDHILKSLVGQLRHAPSHSDTEAAPETDPESPFDVRQWLKKRVVLLTLLGLGLGLFFVGYCQNTSEHDPKVPDVIGMSLSDAKTALAEQNLSYVIATYRLHPSIKEGHIVDTRPYVGRRVKDNRAIQLIVSKGISQVYLPDLTLRSVSQAEAMVSDQALKIVVIDSLYSADVQKGFIIAQTPTPNSQIAQGDTVHVVLSKGFPVNYSVFPSNYAGKLKVNLNLKVLPEWSPQLITVQIQNGLFTQTVLSKTLNPADELTFNYDAPENATVIVEYNHALALKEKIILPPPPPQVASTNVTENATPKAP